MTTSSRGVWAICLAATAAAAVAAGQATVQRGLGAPASALYVAPHSERITSNPRLRDELLQGPHEYFRFVNVPFSQTVCRIFEDELDAMPRVTLHGDAHLEQYAVTDAGRGITDFDDTSTGPAVIDLVRFGVSIRLAARAHGWDADPLQVFRLFLDGYRAGLEDPGRELPEPEAAKRMEADFAPGRGPFLAWVDALMSPLDEETRRLLEKAVAEYSRPQLEAVADLPPGFFAIERAGRIGLGIGSALDEKYLLRLRGESDDPEDDLVLEAKEVRDLGQIDCIEAGPKADPFRVLVGRVRIPYRPYLGYFRMRGKVFWVHAWIGNYKELSIADSIRTPSELAEIAFEAGVQLARAHFDDRPRAESAEARRVQRELLDRWEPRLGEVVVEMADRTVEAWQRFRAAAARERSHAASGR